MQAQGWSRIVRAHRCLSVRNFSSGQGRWKDSSDPRIRDLGRLIEDDYATIRNEYSMFRYQQTSVIRSGLTLPGKPKNPIVLAHGLFGFDQIHLAGPRLPGIHYWRGIIDALSAKGIECFTAAVPPSGSIEARADKLRSYIEDKAAGRSVNIIA